MGMSVYQDVFGCAMRHQDLHDAADIASFLGSGIELAIRVGTGSSLPKAIVGIWMYYPLLVDSSEVPAAD